MQADHETNTAPAAMVRALAHFEDMVRRHKFGDRSGASVAEARAAVLALAAPAAQGASQEPDPELQEKINGNRWDHLSDVMPVLQAAAAGDWQWYCNTQCKYVELRIDMRSGHCLIRDRERNRILPKTLAYQFKPPGKGDGWPGYAPAAAPVGQASTQDPAPVAWLHEKGISALTAEEMETARNHLGPAGLRKAALHSIPLVRQVAGQAEDAAQTTHVHYRTGGKYRKLGEAELQTDAPLSDMARVVVYQGEDGRLWARERDEFMGRFVPQQAGQAETGEPT